jgi:hypothetical protein
MKFAHSIHLLGATLLFLFIAVAEASAQDAASRIRQRLPEIDVLKAAGVFGENNLGYIEERTELTESQVALLEAENADRKALYAYIAEKTSSTVKEVGKQRAVRIAEQAKEGVWIENAKGKWVKKGKSP